MNKIKLACLAALFASNVASAATHCNGFDVKIKNDLADDLIVSSIRFQGADLIPGGVDKIGTKSQQVFTVSNSQAHIPINAEFVFHTLSIPSREVKINFVLKNKALVCAHTDNTPESDYNVTKTRLHGTVHYTINNK